MAKPTFTPSEGIEQGKLIKADHLLNLEEVLQDIIEFLPDGFDQAVEADVDSGLDAAANLQELAEALSARIKVLEDAE